MRQGGLKIFWLIPFAAILLFTLPLIGCENSGSPLHPIINIWDGDTDEELSRELPHPDTPEAQDNSPTEPPEDPSQEPPGRDEVPSDFDGVVWLHEDVSSWRETGNLGSVKVSGNRISLDYNKARSWPGKNHAGAFVNANPWIFVYHDGAWYAGTWEWLRFGQTNKSVRSVNGDHIKKRPLNDFRPRSGERYGFMVSGLARDNARNVRERTQVLMYTWP